MLIGGDITQAGALRNLSFREAQPKTLVTTDHWLKNNEAYSVYAFGGVKQQWYFTGGDNLILSVGGYDD